MRQTLLVALCLLVCTAAHAGAAEWLSLRTPNFLFVGDATGGDIRDVAVRFEQFREAVTTAFPVFTDRRPGPPVVVFVFRNRRSFEPFLPQYDGKSVQVGGYYVSGRDVNYIALSADTRGADFQTVYHEYAHLLLHRVMSNLPPWFNEGVAEYFSTFELVGRDKANFGEAILRHVGLLRERQMPLSELFAVTHDSPVYNEGARRGLFYAQSWALLHYAIVARAERFPQLTQFLKLRDGGEPVATAFEHAFGFATTELDEELRKYMLRTSLGYAVVDLDQRIASRVQGTVTPVTEAEADAWLGDLLAHNDRPDAATARLEKSLAAAPDLALAHASLGSLLMRQGKHDAAMVHLQRAAELDSPNEFVHFYYGAALVERAGADPTGPEARASLPGAVAALTRAVAMRPGFTEAGTLLGFAHLLLDDAQTSRDVLRRVRAEDPSDERAALILAQAELRLGNLAEARALLGPLVGRAADKGVKEQARRVLAQSADIERRRQLFSEHLPATTAPTAAPAPVPNGGGAEAFSSALRGSASGPGSSPGYRPVFRELLPGETRVRGMLSTMECANGRIVLHLRTAGGTYQVAAERFDDIDFISYRSTTPSSIACGPLGSPEDVYLTSRPDTGPDGQARDIPTVVAVELLPEGFVER